MLKEIKKTLIPPYDLKDLFSIFIALFLMLTIPLTVMQVTNTRDSRSNAADLSGNSPLRAVINSPVNGSNVSGIVNIAAEAIDTSSEVVSLSLLVDGKVLATNNNPNSSRTFSTSFSWDSTKGSNGKKSLQVQASNSKSQEQISSPINVTVINNDTIAPSINFSTPNDGNYISGSTYLIKINAGDDQALERVSLEIDGKAIKQFRKIPYEYLWNISEEKAGNHTIKATAVDYSGNESSTTITIYKGTQKINSN